MTDRYPLPHHTELVYVGPEGYIDRSARRASFAPDEAEKFDLRNASIQFRMGKHPEHIASWISKLTSLGVNYMDTDGAIIDSLREVAARLDYGLFVNGNIKKSVRWVGVKSNIRLLTIYESEVFFDETSFPKLESLKASKDKSGKLLNYVSHRQLRHLGLSGFDPAVIDGSARIESLQISGATERRLDFNEKTSVNDPWLHSLRSLEDVTFLARLPNIERLKIYYCRKITDFSPLLNLKSLKQVEIVQQGLPADIPTFKSLAASGIDVSGFIMPD